MLRSGVDPEQRTTPREPTVAKIARFFSWPLGDALRWAGYDVDFDPAASPAVEPSSNQRRELDQLWPLLTGSQQRALVYVAATMVAPHQWPEFGGTRPRLEPTTQSGDDVVRVIDLGHIDDDVNEADRVRDEPEQHESNG